MVSFDRSVVYQFSLFLDEERPASSDTVLKLGGLVANPIVGVPGLGLKFGAAPDLEHGLVMQSRGALAPAATLTWKAGSGIWRLALSPTRLDLHFDARGYADVTESALESLQTVVRRVVPNLASVPGLLADTPIHRLALIATLQGSVVDQPTDAGFVADMFLNQDIRDEVRGGDVTDLTVKLNREIRWQLGDSDVPVNRIETATVQTVFRGATEDATLTWQLDANTTPRGSPHTFNEQQLSTFFHNAERWASSRLFALGVNSQ